jgi:hypothetical protein
MPVIPAIARSLKYKDHSPGLPWQKWRPISKNNHRENKRVGGMAPAVGNPEFNPQYQGEGQRGRRSRRRRRRKKEEEGGVGGRRRRKKRKRGRGRRGRGRRRKKMKRREKEGVGGRKAEAWEG